MIEINVMYQLYIEKLNISLEEYKEVIETNLKYKKQYLELIEKFKREINKYSNLDYDTIIKAKTINVLDGVEFKKAFNNGKEINFNIIKLYIEKYITHSVALNKATKYEKDIKNKIVKAVIYKKIINKFNVKVIDKIIYDNYYFSINPLFGSIGVVQNENKNKRPDWGRSNKLRQQIIDKGGIPYLKDEAEKDPNYKGEEWLIYHPAIDFFVQWHTKYIAKKFNPVLGDYKYKPARGKTSIVTKLNEVKCDRDRAFALYTRTPNYKANEQV